ncbi:hypothetical protein BS47DRAFT_1391345 [Hydnum rufescens UP504]|uniref:Fungal lipase-type domain-containing protein n=1 Tax=Hydnum rufescens UP504 TaxID=1448309 RepID=A0A9P6B1E5_9AGAM|nr:hypothetical protein BS47DRAFT_1391345 [Hydnum rufescens UP504]
MSAAPPPLQATPNGSAPAEPAVYDERYEEEIHTALQKIRERGIQYPSPGFLLHFLLNIPLVRKTGGIFRGSMALGRRSSYRTWDFIVKAPNRIELTPESEESESTGVGDWLADVLVAFGGTVVLPFVLVLCLVAQFPPLTWTYHAWSALFGGDLGLINSSNPNLFKSLTPTQAQYGKDALGLSPSIDPDGRARTLIDFPSIISLQIASVIYEHSNDAIHSEVLVAQTSLAASLPSWNLLVMLLSADFAGNFTSSTGAVEFGKWLSDLDANMVHCEHIPGFRWVHKGFKERVFPNRGRRPSDHEQHPYKTISKSVQALVAHLSERRGGEKINVWFTGHSLMRCATATLIYSRMLMKPEEVGENGILRDAYLFGAPVVADPESVDAFNNKMFEKAPRTYDVENNIE